MHEKVDGGAFLRDELDCVSKWTALDAYVVQMEFTTSVWTKGL